MPVLPSSRNQSIDLLFKGKTGTQWVNLSWKIYRGSMIVSYEPIKYHDIIIILLWKVNLLNSVFLTLRAIEFLIRP